MDKSYDVEKLRGSDNYHTWCFAIRNVLILKGYEKCIASEETESNAIKLNSCRALLSLSVEKHIYVHIQNCTSALNIWTTLQGLYDDKGLSRKIGLLRNLISIRLDESDSMQQYVDNIVGNAGKLSGIGFALSDEWIAAILLAGLSENYRPFIMGIEAANTDLKSDAIISKLLDGQSSENAKGEALFSGKKSKNSNKNFKKIKCAYCGKKGHTIDVCRKKKAENDSKNGSDGSGKAKSAFIAHAHAQATKTKNENSALTAQNNATRMNDWYVDSGASSHMTPYAQLLANVRPTHVNEILSANSAKLNVRGAGNTVLKLCDNEIPVKNVLHVPELSANLLSVFHIANKGNSVTFDKNGCTIRNAENEVVAECKPENGVYKFQATQGMCMLARNKEKAMTWHRRLGHINYQRLRQMRDEAVDGIEFADEDAEIRKCEVCARGKQCRLPFKQSKSQSTNILDLIHSDIAGPMENSSIGGARYLLTFVDDFSKKTFVYFLKAKSDVLSTFRNFKSYIENQTEKKIKVFRTDNGTEYCSNDFDNFCRKNGIQHQLTNVYTPQQNGVAERMNRSLVEKAKCLLFDANLPKKFWAEAIGMATYIINRSIAASHGKIPEEMFYGKRIDLSDLKIFGSDVMVLVPKQRRRKWDKNSEKMTFVGIDENTKGYRCIDRSTYKLTISRDVIFHENIPEKAMAITDEGISDSVRDSDEENDDQSTLDTESPGKEPDEAEEDNTSFESTNETTDDQNTTDSNYEPDETLGTVPAQRMQTRSQTGSTIHPFQLTNFAFFIDPNTVTEAMNGPNAEDWKTAMNNEMRSHDENKTWTIVDLPDGRKPIKGKWVFKAKTDENGNVTRYKARLVAKGCSQKYGIDYGETFAPVIRYTSIRFLIALAAKNHLKIHQMDAITAFLQGDLDETIYMEQPELYSDGTKRVCKLNRAIYGLKQAGRQWNIKLDAALRKFGLVKSKLDPCLYYSGNLNHLVAIYVDDFLIFYKSDKQLDKLKRFLCETFKMKDIGPAKHCIGVRIQQEIDTIRLDQTNYIREILERFGMGECKPVGTPSDTNQKLSTQMVNDENSIVGQVPYQEAVGCLLYLAGATRPDIAFAVNDVSRFNANHSEQHWSAVKRIFRYLKGTMDLGLTYKGSGDSKLHAFCDADWASDIDKRRSCTGLVTIMSGAAISWTSKRQPIVALSSTEAEYIAMSSAVNEIIWLKQLADEINKDIVGKVTLYCDNQSAIKLSESDAFRPRTKHIDIRYHHLREKVDEGVIDVKFTSTNLMAADSLTKAVTKEKHQFCANQFGLMN